MGDESNINQGLSIVRAVRNTKSTPFEDAAAVLSFPIPPTLWVDGVSDEAVHSALGFCLAARKAQRAERLIAMLHDVTPDSAEVDMSSDNKGSVESSSELEARAATTLASVRHFPKEKRTKQGSAMVFMDMAQRQAQEAFEESEENVRRLEEDLSTERDAHEAARKELGSFIERSKVAREAAAREADMALQDAVAATQAVAAEKERVTRQRYEEEIEAAREQASATAKSQVWGRVVKLLTALVVIAATVVAAHWVFG